MEPPKGNPNIFDYATKELSQDAMICWLLAWSDQRYQAEQEALHDCGVQFLRSLLDKHKTNLVDQVENIEIHQQERSIDVLVRINGKHVLLIEDKTNSEDHDKQLPRYYKDIVENRTKIGKVEKKDLYPIYFKTGNQSHAGERRIENIENYKVFNRKDFLKVLDGYKGQNSILLDFRQYLQGLEAETNSYVEWAEDSEMDSWRAWEGFYRRLEVELFHQRPSCGSDWGYVPNASGGFLGFWWSPSDHDKIYLQIEGGRKDAKLCFKVDAAGSDSDEQGRLKWEWHERVMVKGGQYVIKPRVMRRGSTMTVAWWKEDWLAYGENGKLDLSQTVKILKQAEEVWKKALAA